MKSNIRDIFQNNIQGGSDQIQIASTTMNDTLSLHKFFHFDQADESVVDCRNLSIQIMQPCDVSVQEKIRVSRKSPDDGVVVEGDVVATKDEEDRGLLLIPTSVASEIDSKKS